MTWTSPRTWVAGAVLTASQMNTHLRDNLLYLANTSGQLNPTANDHYFGAYAKGTGTGVSRLHVLTDASGIILAAEGDGTDRGVRLAQKGTGNFKFQTDAGVVLAQIDSDGDLKAIGSDHYFGPYALGTGSTVSRLRVSNSSTGVFLMAEGDGSNRDLVYRTKGTGDHLLQDGSGGSLLTVTDKGHLVSGSAGGAPTIASNLANWAASIAGTDTAGVITFTNNTGGPVGVMPIGTHLITVTFANAFGAAPVVVVVPNNNLAAANDPYPDTTSTTTFVVASGDTTGAVTTANGQSWTFNYHVLGV